MMATLAFNELMVYNFIEVNWVMAALFCHTYEPSYLINATEKGIADAMVKDHVGHVILEKEQFLRGKYLKKRLVIITSKVRSDILQWNVNITATKVFDMFIGTNKNLTIAKKSWNNSY